MRHNHSSELVHDDLRRALEEAGWRYTRQRQEVFDYLRSVVFDDSLGVADELDATMARHVDTYECEWKATLESPARLARFQSFVNTDQPDPITVPPMPRSFRRGELP